MPLILDNIGSSLETALLDSLASSRRFDASVGYFNLRGWSLVAKAVEALPAQAVDALPVGIEGRPKVRLLVGMTENPQDEMRRLMRARAERPTTNAVAAARCDETIKEFRAQLQVGLPTPQDEAALRTLRRQMACGDVEVRLFLAHRLHAKLYLCHRDDAAAPRVGYVGSSNLTKAGLREQGELNVDVLDGDATAKLASWFDERWWDQFTVPVNPELIEVLDECWASRTPLDPFLVYLKMAYHLSREAREGLVQYGLPSSMAEELLDFQVAAVKIAARIVQQRGGAMVGDVVGLGKTMIGTAVARLLQEEQGIETLIVCPKNLVSMWESYRHEYRLHGQVMSLSMASKELGKLPRHRLVLVDESHNLRNPKRRDYRALSEYISRNDPKVLLLTATPYNKQLDDVAAQLGLFVSVDDDLGVRPERAIAEHGEAEFSRLCDGRPSSLAAFRRSEHLEDWQALMSQFLVRRTRRFIQDNYARDDGSGRKCLRFGDGSDFYFPARKAVPVEREISADDPAALMIADDTLEAVASLRLPRYSMSRYLDPEAAPTPQEQDVINDLKNAANGNLSGFNRIMMFKRLSSSGPAFLATLRRHALRNLVALHATVDDRLLPVGSVDNSLWSAELDAERGDLFEAGLLDGGDVSRSVPVVAYEKLVAAGSKRIRWLRPRLFADEFAEALRHDAGIIRDLLNEFGSWEPDRDGKIAALADLISRRHADEKVLVFTEAADTARYVAGELGRRGVAGVEAVTGNSEDPTALACRFAPKANQGIVGHGGGAELRVLVSTDVLSEGQNLQDAHIVVNYDLPWAIVKLVQRAGRVDRIGQAARQVVVYSMLPAASVDEVIDLRRRIRRRLRENAQLLGSDEKFFGDDGEREAIDGLYDEHSFQFDEGEDVDPVSMAYEIWRRAAAEYPELAKKVESLPNVVYATKACGTAVDAVENESGSGEPTMERPTMERPKQERPTQERASREHREGVLVHSQTVTGSDAFAFAEIGGDARRLTPQDALRLACCEPDTPAAERLDGHHEMVARALRGPLRTPPGRATGALTGVRLRCWRKLRDHRSTLAPNVLFDADELDAALDSINERPLFESASQKLAVALRQRTAEDLAALVVGLHLDGRLCHSPPTDGRAEPSVICSMGLRR